MVDIFTETPAATGAPSPVPHVGPWTPLDLDGMALARPVTIGAREGLPGQRPVVLEDALKSSSYVWLRFRVTGGSTTAVERVAWEHGEISTVRPVIDGKDLRVVVQLPAADVTKKTRVQVWLTGDRHEYSFALRSGTFSAFLKSLF
jgi:hypothetical protein